MAKGLVMLLLAKSTIILCFYSAENISTVECSSRSIWTRRAATKKNITRQGRQEAGFSKKNDGGLRLGQVVLLGSFSSS